MTPDPEAIAARYFECGSVRKVAREFGLTRAVVCTRLRWMGVPEGVAVPTREPAAPPRQARGGDKGRVSLQKRDDRRRLGHRQELTVALDNPGPVHH